MLTFARAIAGWADGYGFPIVAPAEKQVLVLRLANATGDHDMARLVDADGTLAWQSDDVQAISGAIWSDDGRTLVVAGRSHSWHVLSIAPDGSATDHVVSLVLDRFVPSPPPVGSLSPPGVEPRTLPLGFSADGRWIYGGFVTPELGTFGSPFRVARDGSRIEWSTTLGVGRRDGLVPIPDSLGQRLIDPTTGRIANWRINSNTSGGPPTIEIRGPDNGFDFLVDEQTPVGSAWGAMGELFVLSADSLLFPQRSVVVGYDEDGVAEAPLIEIGPVTGTGLLGYRDGFIGLGITVSRPQLAGQIVLVDVADRSRRTAIDLPTDVTERLAAIRLRPAADSVALAR
ncbi:MAG: hypothetical protein QOF49_1060 [Chloroflexota bacterium]|nr:hypothetical protein [Chloroflexota bacterium]